MWLPPGEAGRRDAIPAGRVETGRAQTAHGGGKVALMARGQGGIEVEMGLWIPFSKGDLAFKYLGRWVGDHSRLLFR